ncbi:MAG: hypothetical protein HFK04_02490 [Oscillospiraceae bacterium]|nr:hypothetical protein [Oscillospiraceae bacterium]
MEPLKKLVLEKSPAEKIFSSFRLKSLRADSAMKTKYEESHAESPGTAKSPTTALVQLPGKKLNRGESPHRFYSCFI